MSHLAQHHRARIKKVQKGPSDRLLVTKLVLAMAVLEPLMTFPQIYEVWSKHEKAGVSLASWSFFLIAAMIWLWYGLRIKDKPLIIASTLWVLMEGALVLGLLVYPS